MRHVHATENCEGEVTGRDYVARIPVHYSRKGRSKRHVSSTPTNKEGRDKPESTGAKNSTRESVSRDGCRRHRDQGGDSQRGCAEYSSEDYSMASDTTSVENDDISDGSRHARGGHPRRTVHRQRHRRRTSHRRRFDHKGSWMKPEKFNGHGSFETFLVQFENCCRYNDWNHGDKAAHLRWSLTGAEDLTYEERLEKLNTRFGGQGMEEKFQTELRCRRRGKGESLRELAQDIRRLMAMAYPGKEVKVKKITIQMTRLLIIRVLRLMFCS